MVPVKLSACSHCNSPNPSLKTKKGAAGYSRTPFYRETITCRKCRIEVTARTPGNAVLQWNRSFAGRTAPAQAEA